MPGHFTPGPPPGTSGEMASRCPSLEATYLGERDPTAAPQ